MIFTIIRSSQDVSKVNGYYTETGNCILIYIPDRQKPSNSNCSPSILEQASLGGSYELALVLMELEQHSIEIASVGVQLTCSILIGEYP